MTDPHEVRDRHSHLAEDVAVAPMTEEHWPAVSAVSDRCVYTGVIEHSVYVHPAASRRGIGHLLLNALIASTETAGIWTIQSGIFPENTASLALHRKAGFREVGIRLRLGRMTHGPYTGQWRDVILLERRSPHTGIDPS
jgi:L-amino acid N-acyltransferase YncA